jgi:hypothetical protein
MLFQICTTEPRTAVLLRTPVVEIYMFMVLEPKAIEVLLRCHVILRQIPVNACHRFGFSALRTHNH